MRVSAMALLASSLWTTGCSLEREGTLNGSPDAGASAVGGSAGGAGQPAGGGSGGADTGADACDGLCTDPHASCETGTCQCEADYLDLDPVPKVASCVLPATIQGVELTVALDHPRLGNLTLKLQSPAGTLLTLMSRPGFTEAADDGSPNGSSLPPFDYGPSGDQSDLVASHPIHFADGAPSDAELMGFDQDGGGLAVCRDPNTQGSVPGPECDYRPNPASAGGSPTFAAAFAGELTTGTWMLCLGDSDPSSTGALRGWSLSFTTAGGPLPAAASDLNETVPDDGYDGTLPSMLCHPLDVP